VEIMGFCHYQFRRSAFAEGNQWISAGLAADVLFIDEVGNIELGGSGWDVERVLARKLPLIFGVREDTVPNLEGRWGITWPRIHINPGTDATEDLMKMLMA
jgi:nucleoside-triphosphatase THEP1